MIPDFQNIMLPLLDSLKDGEAHTLQQIHDTLAAYFELDDEEINSLFDDRLHQAKLHLQMADLLQQSNQDFLKITPLGKQILHKRLNVIDTNFLRRLPGYIEAANQ